ncbi:class V lanthionine synthetase subunit LxmK [Nocardia terpenica]|nr:class V lanthionine synthetase subunit LxmK [Nocardia terpenica]
MSGSNSTGSTTHRVLPADLGTAPEVAVFLRTLGLGEFVPSSVAAYPGRNNNWAGVTSTGHGVFVKRLDGDPADSLRRLHRVLTFERLLGICTGEHLPRPQCLGVDEPARLLAFELVDSRSGSELMADDCFTPGLSHDVGRAVGTLHQLPVDTDIELDLSPHPAPPVRFTEALPQRVFTTSTGGELEVWRLLQNDAEICRALHDLRHQESVASPSPTHGDLRLDQLLVDGGKVYVSDWEEFRLADPARDIGSFVGELVWNAISKIPESTTADGRDLPPTHEAVMARGAQELRRLRPLIAAFRTGYKAVRGNIDADLLVRAAAFAGWHLLDRVLASAGAHARLSAMQRATVGIARKILLAPQLFTTALALEEA